MTNFHRSVNVSDTVSVFTSREFRWECELCIHIHINSAFVFLNKFSKNFSLSVPTWWHKSFFFFSFNSLYSFFFRTWPFIIKSPKQYKNLSFMDAMNKFKWSRSEGLSYNELVLKLPVNVRCSKTDNAEWSVSLFLSIFLSVKKEKAKMPWNKWGLPCLIEYE